MEKFITEEEILNQASKLVEQIKKDAIYQEYILIRKKLENNKEIMAKIKYIKTLQQKYIKSAYLNKEIETKLNKVTNELMAMSLYQEYLLKQKKLNDILTNFEEGLNQAFTMILENDIPNK